MPTPAAAHATLDDRIARGAVSFSFGADGDESFDAAVQQIVTTLGDSVDLLGLGEPLHGGEDFLVLRNRLFQRLVAAHDFTAIAIESSFPRGCAVDDYVARRGTATTYDDVREAGFSHGFGRLETTRELVEWMRRYNAEPAHAVKLRFYGFDGPVEMMYADSPRRVLHAALDELARADAASAAARRERIDALLGDDATWENPATAMDPSKSVGLTPAAAALRVETEELITALLLRRPELTETPGVSHRYEQAARHASLARQLLTYHAGMAGTSPDRIAELLGVRDLMMADTLAHAVAREAARGGRMLAFAHNKHLQRGPAHWRLGPHDLKWWPAGAQVGAMLGTRYAVIGTALGASAENGLAPPEPGTLEARLLATPGPARFIPTRREAPLDASAVSDLPVRSGGRNPTYFPLTPQSLTDFDALLALDTTTYARGGPPLP